VWGVLTLRMDAHGSFLRQTGGNRKLSLEAIATTKKKQHEVYVSENRTWHLIGSEQAGFD